MSHITTPAPAPAEASGKGLSVAALVLGIVAAAGCLVPVLNIISIVTAVVGLVLGIVALVKRRNGRGLAVAGVVLSIVAVVVAVIVNVLAATAVTAVDDAVDQAVTDAENGYSTVAPEEAAAAVDAALALGTPATVGDYTVAITAVNQDATQAIAEANEFNEPAVGRYVLVDVSVTYNGTEPEANPWIDLDLGFQGTDARNYSTASCSAVVPSPAINGPALRTGGSATFQECFDVPADAVAGGLVSADETLSFTSEQAVWSID